ncbi:MAG: GC-type dockerin domain-anchored protein [Planctomycetota bacterium]
MPYRTSIPTGSATLLGVAIAALSLPVLHARSQPVPILNPTLEIIADAPLPGDRLGTALSIDAGRLLVGATPTPLPPSFPQPRPGFAAIFDAQTGAQLLTLTPADSAPSDAFGSAVALQSNIAAVGAPAAFDQSSAELGQTGTAYLFSAVSGAQFFQLTPPNLAAGDAFGSSIAITDAHVSVGAPFRSTTQPVAGAVDLFSALNGQHTATLVAPPADAIPGALFGNALAVNATTIAIGAPGEPNPGAFDDPTAGPFAGAVYLFDLATHQLIARLTPPNTAAGDRFGAAVSLSSTTLAVGAPGRDAGADDSGAVYLYSLTSLTTPTTLALPGATGPAPTAAFGTTVALTEALLAVGAPGVDRGTLNTGAAFLFDATTAEPLRDLFRTDLDALDAFGTAVATDEDLIAASVPLADHSGVSEAGLIAMFRALARCGPADIASPRGLLDLGDIDAFVVAFLDGNTDADLAPPTGVIDLDDIDAFIQSFLAGCP